MGIEKNINAEGFFGKLQQALRDGLGREMAGGANLGTITLDVKDVRMDRAEAGIGRAEALNRSFSQRPSGGYSGNWDRPEDYPERDLGPMGSRRWAAIMQEGGIHALRNAGTFYQRWGGTLGEQDRGEASMWAAIAGSPQGRKVEESFSGLERAGKKMAELMTEYEQAGSGTPAAMRATEQMVKLHEAIQSLAKSGKEAADAIGGEHGGKLNRELDDLRAQVGEGRAGGSGGAGGVGGLRGSVGAFRRMAHGDMLGAVQEIFGMAALRRLNGAFAADSILGEGGAMAALGGGVGGAAAIGGMGLAALYGGFKAGSWLSGIGINDVVPDATKFLDDYRMSQGLGAGFSLRGMSYSKNGTHLSEGSAHWRSNWNMDAIRRLLPAMNIGAGGWAEGNVELAGTADSIFRRSQDMGVSDSALAGFVGQSIRSGETGRSSFDVNRRLDRIAGLIAEGNRQGISSNEYLGALASMRQAEMARVGFITQAGMRYVENVGRTLNASGSEMLKGAQGASFMQSLMNNQNPVFTSMAALSLMGPNGQLNAEGEKYLQEAFQAAHASPEMQAAARAKGGAWLAMALTKEGPVKLRMSADFMKRYPGMNSFAQDAFFGQNGPSLKFAFGSYALTHGGAHGADWSFVSNPDIPPDQKSKASAYESAMALELMTKEVLGTTRSLAGLNRAIEAQLLEQFKKKDAEYYLWHGGGAAPSSRGGRQPDGAPMSATPGYH